MLGVVGQQCCVRLRGGLISLSKKAYFWRIRENPTDVTGKESFRAEFPCLLLFLLMSRNCTLLSSFLSCSGPHKRAIFLYLCQSVFSTGLINGTYQDLRVNNRPLPLPRGDGWTSLNRPWWGYWMLFYTILYVFTTSSSHEIFLISFCRL